MRVFEQPVGSASTAVERRRETRCPVFVVEMMVSTTCARLNDYCRDPGHRRASATSRPTPNSSTLLHCPLLTPTPCYCSCLIESTGTSHRHAPLHRPAS
ncbi:hypothetical protein BDR06DRAFT_416279 [Suillus hirtellus]|nr:hypothetical protein BDR06DRAFT_416279 [Suillus hirtellus]